MPGNLMQSVVKLLLALSAVIVLAYISLRLTNKCQYKQNRFKGLQVLERIPLQNKQFLCLVKVFDSYMVMGVSENNIQAIKTLDIEEIEEYEAQKKQAADSFNNLSSNIHQWVKRGGHHE